MTKIIALLVGILVWVTASNSLCPPTSTPTLSAINGIETSAPEVSYQDISTEEDYISLVENGAFLQADSSFYTNSFWVDVDSKHSLFAMQTTKGAILLLSGKDFCLTPTEVWYTSNNGVKHFNYADAYFMYLDRGTLLNPDGIDIDELLKNR
mgnify:CR=1 FL=1